MLNFDWIFPDSHILLSPIYVTGLFDERKRLEASVSITTLNVKQMEPE